MSRSIRLTVLVGYKTNEFEKCPRDNYGYPVTSFSKIVSNEYGVVFIEDRGYEYYGTIVKDCDAKYETMDNIEIDEEFMHTTSESCVKSCRASGFECSSPPKLFVILRDDS